MVHGLHEAERAPHARQLVDPPGGRLRGAARVVRGPRVELPEIGPRRPLGLQEELHDQVPEAQGARVMAFDGRTRRSISGSSSESPRLRPPRLLRLGAGLGRGSGGSPAPAFASAPSLVPVIVCLSFSFSFSPPRFLWG